MNEVNITNTRKCYSKLMRLAGAVLGVLMLSGSAFCQSPSLGNNFEEVVKLATKEGRVRVGSGLTTEEAPFVLKGFNQKYPMIKVELTR